jgi:hypothetical protein
LVDERLLLQIRCLPNAMRVPKRYAGGALSTDDLQFVTPAAQSGWAEVSAGERAQKDGGGDAVPQYRAAHSTRLTRVAGRAIASRAPFRPAS